MHASIATIPGRADILYNTVQSLLPQVDAIHIAFNYGTEPLPDWVHNMRKVTYSLHDNSQGDAVKFLQAGSGWVAICDDDIIYPRDYIRYMVSRARRHKSVVTVAGSLIPGKIQSYYNDRKKVSTPFTQKKTKPDMRVHIGATGGMVYNSGLISFPLSIFERPNMSDIYASAWCQQQGVKIICVAKPKGWLKEQQREGRWSIYSTRAEHDTLQAAECNKVEWI